MTLKMNYKPFFEEAPSDLKSVKVTLGKFLLILKKVLRHFQGFRVKFFWVIECKIILVITGE